MLKNTLVNFRYLCLLATLVSRDGRDKEGASRRDGLCPRAGAMADAEAKLCTACNNAEQPLAARSWHSCMMCKDRVQGASPLAHHVRRRLDAGWRWAGVGSAGL